MSPYAFGCEDCHNSFETLSEKRSHECNWAVADDDVTLSVRLSCPDRDDVVVEF